MKRIKKDPTMIAMIDSVNISNIDVEAVNRTYKAIYGDAYEEEITDISNFCIEEIQTYGINYGTNYDDDAALYFNCIENNSYRMRTNIPLSYYVLGSAELSFEYISKFDYDRDQIEVLLSNKNISDETRIFLKLL
jgi:hypothetical protein